MRVKIYILFYGDVTLAVACRQMKFGPVRYDGHTYKFYLNFV
jgi:hypothetical protein